MFSGMFRVSRCVLCTPRRVSCISGCVSCIPRCVPRCVSCVARCVSCITRAADLPWPIFPLGAQGNVWQKWRLMKCDQVSLRLATDMAAWMPSRLCSCFFTVRIFQQLRKAPVNQVLIYLIVCGPWHQVKTQPLSWASLSCFPGKTPPQPWALMVSERMARGREKSRWEAGEVWGDSTSSSGGAVSLHQVLLEAGQALS